MNSNSILQDFFKNDRQMFINMFESLTVLDIGIIRTVTEDGRANVDSSSFINGKPINYKDAEIIYPGNTNGTYGSASPGMACLIFIPRSCMPRINTLKLLIGATSYNRGGIKVMPIGNGAANTVQTMFTDGGEFGILGQAYQVQFNAYDIAMQRRDGALAIAIDGKGQMYLNYKGTNCSYSISLEDGTLTKQWISKNGDVAWTDILNSDGSRTFVQKDPRDENADPLFSLTIAADGSLTLTGVAAQELTIGGDATITVDGDVKLDADNIELNGNDKRLVTYGELKEAMDKLWVAMTTTPIAGNGSTQPSWTGITGIDISASETQTIKTGG